VVKEREGAPGSAVRHPGEVDSAGQGAEAGDSECCMAREVVAAFQGVGDACLSPVQPEGTARG